MTGSKETVQGNAWLEFLSFDEPSDEPVSYQVSVNGQGEYEILDAGGEPINLRPSLKIGAPNAASSVRTLAKVFCGIMESLSIYDYDFEEQ